MIDKNIIDKIVSDEAIDERININLNTDQLTYGQIIDDSKNLIINLKMSIAQQTLQIEIYEKLIRRCLTRSMLQEKED